MNQEKSSLEEKQVLVKVLIKHRNAILDAWLYNIHEQSTTELPGKSLLIKLRGQMFEFITLLATIFQERDTTQSKDAIFDQISRLSREMMMGLPANISSPTDSANFLFSLRKTLIPFIQEGSEENFQLFAYEIEQMSWAIDHLRLLDLEHYIQNRENVISEQSRTMIELAESSAKNKSLFLASMSHEIRTPINAILGMGELLAESDLQPEQASFVTIANKAGETLLALINDILDISKIEAGQLELETLNFNLAELIKDTSEILSLQAKDKGLALNLEPEPFPTDAWVSGDPTRVQQVLLNLLSNAIKFTQDGRISILFMQNPQGMISISISDTGIGIPIEKQERLFQPFTQADASISRQYRGTGLGLAICRQLAEKMGGTIELKSDVGLGSIFTFHVPLPAVEATSTTDAHENKSQKSTGQLVNEGNKKKSLSILLVDDAEENRLIFKAFLKGSNHKIKTARDGAEALMKFREKKFDIILMDVEMPVMDGYTATKSIRAWERENGRKETPIIALTAHAMREHFEKSMEAGCNLHLTKPIRKQHLLDSIAQFQGMIMAE